MGKLRRASESSSSKDCGKLIVFEGPDGVGKSTIAKAVAETLTRQGVRCRYMSFPGREDGTLGKLVYRLHHDAAHYGVREMSAMARQALHVAAHLDVIERQILPLLRSGETILLDRYWWSTLVYGEADGADGDALCALIEPELRLWKSVAPIVVLVDRDKPINRDEELGHWKKLRSLYALMAKRERGRSDVVLLRNAGRLENAVATAIAELVARKVVPKKKAQTAKGDQIPLNLAPKVEGNKRPRPELFSRLAPAKPTIVLDSYWRFAAERQEIFFRRLQGLRRPWTHDPILEEHKFTNAYRASDRVSQYLIRRVIYRDDLPGTEEEVCFRILVYKLFNKIETWELLEAELGAVTYADYSFKRYDGILARALQKGQRIYSAAYIMPPGGTAFGHAAKHQNHLRLLELMMRDELPLKLAGLKKMQQAFELLRSYPTIGDFLAYQFATDINYSTVTDFPEMEFVMPGPGALDGIRKCFASLGGLNEPEIIRLMADIQADEFARLGLQFRSLFGRPLQLIDCQNLFCETDKYARVAHPEFVGRTGRSRIKQKFSPIAEPIAFWYPPKWGLNDTVAGFQGRIAKTAA